MKFGTSVSCPPFLTRTEIAKANGRSTTAEVLLRLEASLLAEAGELSFTLTARAAAAKVMPRDPDLETRVSELENAVKALQAAQIERQ